MRYNLVYLSGWSLSIYWWRQSTTRERISSKHVHLCQQLDQTWTICLDIGQVRVRVENWQYEITSALRNYTLTHNSINTIFLSVSCSGGDSWGKSTAQERISSEHAIMHYRLHQTCTIRLGFNHVGFCKENCTWRTHCLWILVFPSRYGSSLNHSSGLCSGTDLPYLFIYLYLDAVQ